MSETLLGVIIGGVIGSVGTFASLFIQNKQWKKEKHIELLKSRRADLERLYRELTPILYEKTSPTRVFGNIISVYGVSIPNEILKAIIEIGTLENEGKGDEDTKAEHLLKTAEVIFKMRASLEKLDKEIADLLK